MTAGVGTDTGACDGDGDSDGNGNGAFVSFSVWVALSLTSSNLSNLAVSTAATAVAADFIWSSVISFRSTSTARIPNRTFLVSSNSLLDEDDEDDEHNPMHFCTVFSVVDCGVDIAIGVDVSIGIQIEIGAPVSCRVVLSCCFVSAFVGRRSSVDGWTNKMRL